MSPFRSTLIVATALSLAGGAAFAQSAPTPAAPQGTAPQATAPAGQVLPTYDPAQLPAIKGKVAQYTLTPRGDIDGLILEDGTQVQIPPPYSTQIVFAVRPGDAVTVHGLKARALPLVAAMSVTNDTTNVTVTLSGFGGPGMGPHHGGHMGPGGPRMAGSPLEATGRIKAQLHGPRGELNGVLLDDGTVVHLPPPEADRLAATLAVGQTLYVSGPGAALPYGRVIGARTIGATKADAKEIAGPRPEMHGGMRGWMHGMMGHRPDGDAGPEAPPPPPAR